MQDLLLEQQVARAALCPADDESGLVRGSFEKFALPHPPRRILFKMRLHRSKHAIHHLIGASFKQIKKPTGYRKLIIINECNKIPSRMFQGFVSRQRDILFRFDAVGHFDGHGGGALRHDSLRRLGMVVVGHHDGVIK